MRDKSRHDATAGHRWVAAAAAAAVLPIALVTMLAPDLRDWDDLADVSRISALLTALVADLLFYVTYRATGGPIGWLVLGMTALTLDSLTLTAMTITDSRALDTHPAWVTLPHLVTTAGVVLLVLLAPRRTLRVDPLVTGIGVGLLITLARTAVISSTSPMNLSSNRLDLLQLSNVILAVAAALGLWRLIVAPARIRSQLSGAWVLLAFGNGIAYLTHPSDLLLGVTVALNTLGAVLIVSLAVELAWLALQDQRETLRRTRAELEEVQTIARGDEARLHEIRATVAGLTSAAQLIRRGDSVPRERREPIESMMASEMDRLQRLLQGSDSTELTTAVDLDSTIEPLVVRHQLRGFRVRWRPSGEQVRARQDQVAEVVNVLLENAFQHAAGAGAWIYTRHIDGIVEIAVADAGPGVDRSLRDHIFEWGERSKRSGGSGIGLNVAQQLTVELGGYLRLVDSPALGATFVLGLPAEDTP
jgi:signal transduction histidine kinase